MYAVLLTLFSLLPLQVVLSKNNVCFDTLSSVHISLHTMQKATVLSSPENFYFVVAEKLVEQASQFCHRNSGIHGNLLDPEKTYQLIKIAFDDTCANPCISKMIICNYFIGWKKNRDCSRLD